MRGARPALALLAAVACGLLAGTLAFGHGGAIRASDAAAAATSGGQAITTPDEAMQFLAHAAPGLGTSPVSAAPAGALPADAPGVLASAPVFRVEMQDGSSCLVLLTGVSGCGAPPDADRPVVGVTADVDGDGSLPFIAVADVSDAVMGVTFVCAGRTVAATIENGLMTLVAPAGLGDPAECTERATLSNGGTWNWSYSR